MQSIHFFRAGRHTSSGGQSINFTERDLDAIAASYDPRTHEAPIVVGHPKTDAPAFGWIERIVAKPDGLHAVPRQVNAEFAELVQQGAYKKVSAAFYPANAANNPKPGAPYLRHVGFLGAEPPAVKGLSAIQFSEGEALFFAEEDMIALREHSITARERQYRRREIEEAICKVQRDGRLPIGLLPGALAFAESLSDMQTFEFSEGDGDDSLSFSQAEWFLDFLSKLPVPVETRELAGATFSEAASDFVRPEGFAVDERSAEIDRIARHHMSQHGGSYAAAARYAETRVSRT